MRGGNLDQLIPEGNMKKQSDKAAKIRQAIYRGATTESIVRNLRATVVQVKHERESLIENGIRKADKYLTTRQAAFLLGLSEEGRRVGVFLRNGRLKHEKIGNNLYITRQDFLEFAAKPRPFGRLDLRRNREEKH